MEEAAGRIEVISDKDDRSGKDEIFTKIVRAGKRTYFFDVKTTRNEDYYLTITESKKRLGKEGKVFYEKHKVFLYKEDFDKFTEGLREAIGFIENEKTSVKKENEVVEVEIIPERQEFITEEFTNVDFDDLGKH
jgi:hypothetical protein